MFDLILQGLGISDAILGTNIVTPKKADARKAAEKQMDMAQKQADAADFQSKERHYAAALYNHVNYLSSIRPSWVSENLDRIKVDFASEYRKKLAFYDNEDMLTGTSFNKDPELFVPKLIAKERKINQYAPSRAKEDPGADDKPEHLIAGTTANQSYFSNTV